MFIIFIVTDMIYTLVYINYIFKLYIQCLELCLMLFINDRMMKEGVMRALSLIIRIIYQILMP